MVHTSTEKAEALRLADLCASDWDLVRPHLVVQMLRDLHYRVQVLEVALVNEADRTADYKQRYEQINQQHSMLAARYAAKGITQEKQG